MHSKKKLAEEKLARLVEAATRFGDGYSVGPHSKPSFALK